MTSPLQTYVVTLPNERRITVEADSTETARAAAAVWIGADLPEGTRVERGVATQAQALLESLRAIDNRVHQLRADARALHLDDCATRLGDASTDLLSALCLLNPSRRDTDLGRSLGNHLDDQRVAA